MPSAAVCLIAKNEGSSILEWMAYYLVIGFDRLLIYDNDSTDDTCEVVDRASRNDARITCIPWPDARGRAPQRAAYNDALTRCETEWIAFLDADEFLFLKQHNNIGAFLSGRDPDAAAVAINWRLFGSSGHILHQPGLVIERFQRCAEPLFPSHLHVKTIARTNTIAECGIHAHKLTRGHYTNAVGHRIEIERLAFAPITHDGAQVNHYVVKSHEEYERKVVRGQGARAADDPLKREKFTPEFWDRHDRNECEDAGILLRAEAVKAEMRRLGRGVGLRMF